MTRLKGTIEGILSMADVTVNGANPWDIRVHNDDFYARVLSKGTLGFGEAYMDGWWDCERLDECIFRLLDANLYHAVGQKNLVFLQVLKAKILNRQSRARAKMVAHKHYNIGNELYRKMLDGRMVYTCAYWKNADNLDRAQEHKLDLVCRKIGLKKGMSVLDIGCGWGSFAKFAAEKYGANVVGITISKPQVELARTLCKGLPVDIQLKDYREVHGTFDRVISLGMFEHVGYKNYRTYMEVVNRCLKDDGLFLLHTFGGNQSDIRCDAWFDKYIFPNGLIPSAAQIGKAAENLLVMEDWHNFGPDYDKTLMTWFANFDRHWPSLSAEYDEKFYRMWKYYLLSLAGAFRARVIQLWQIVYSKKGVLGGYESLR